MSSDSDDDYYGNATKKLQHLIKNYSEDKVDTANLLDDSSVQPILEVSDEAAVTTEDVKTDINKDDSLYEDDVVLDQIIALNTFRQTRSTTGAIAKRRGRGAKRARGIASKSQSNLSKDTQKSDTEVLSGINTSNISIAESMCGRSRSKRALCRRAVRTERNQRTNVENRQTQPTYSVGNTDEYPDLSDKVQLFNTKPLTQEVDDVLDENEEQSVKVYWRSSEIVKFTIRKFQKISQIFEFFAKKENVTADKLLLSYNDRILKPDDTPDKIDYNIAKFIEGGIVKSVPVLLDSEDTNGHSNEEFGNGIKLKFQCQNVKKPFILSVQKEEKLLQAMVKCAEHLEEPFNVLKFVFDGDVVSGSMTPEDLDLEGGECIDVKIVR